MFTVHLKFGAALWADDFNIESPLAWLERSPVPKIGRVKQIDDVLACGASR
jgi:hypothetical protein